VAVIQPDVNLLELQTGIALTFGTVLASASVAGTPTYSFAYPNSMQVNQKGSFDSIRLPGEIWVIGPDRKYCRTIQVPDRPAKLGLGAVAGKRFIKLSAGLISRAGNNASPSRSIGNKFAMA
jgi:hypothetical protein